LLQLRLQRRSLRLQIGDLLLQRCRRLSSGVRRSLRFLRLDVVLQLDLLSFL